MKLRQAEQEVERRKRAKAKRDKENAGIKIVTQDEWPYNEIYGTLMETFHMSMVDIAETPEYLIDIWYRQAVYRREVESYHRQLSSF